MHVPLLHMIRCGESVNRGQKRGVLSMWWGAVVSARVWLGPVFVLEVEAQQREEKGQCGADGHEGKFV